MEATAPDTRHRGPLDRLLGIFTDVHGGEGFTALFLFANVFRRTVLMSSPRSNGRSLEHILMTVRQTPAGGVISTGVFQLW